MLYLIIGIIFGILGWWQMSCRGEWSQILRSLFFLLAIFFVILAKSNSANSILFTIIWFIIFSFFSFFLLKLIFNFSTYHKHFLYALPILILYSFVIGYFLSVFYSYEGLAVYIIIILISANELWEKQKLYFEELFSEEELEKEEELRRGLLESKKNTTKYFIISILIYVTGLIGVFNFFE